MNQKFPKYLAGSVLLALSLNVSAEEITVSAAASLKEAFGEIAAQYQQKYPDAKINLNTAASGRAKPDSGEYPQNLRAQLAGAGDPEK